MLNDMLGIEPKSVVPTSKPTVAKNYAVINDATGVVEGVIVCDRAPCNPEDPESWCPPKGYTCALYEEYDGHDKRGCVWDGKRAVPRKP